MERGARKSGMTCPEGRELPCQTPPAPHQSRRHWTPISKLAYPRCILLGPFFGPDLFCHIADAAPFIRPLALPWIDLDCRSQSLPPTQKHPYAMEECPYGPGFRCAHHDYKLYVCSPNAWRLVAAPAIARHDKSESAAPAMSGRGCHLLIWGWRRHEVSLGT